MIKEALKNCAKYMLDPKNNSMQLFVTAATGWLLASLAQTTGLIANKEISKEEKKFLIPQEICDGIFNIGSYAGITLSLMKGAEKLFDPAKPRIKLSEDALKNVINKLKNDKVISASANLKDATKDAYKFMGGNAKTLATIVGTILSACILTPVARNFVSGKIQKHFKDNNVSNETILKNQPSSQPMYAPANNVKQGPLTMNSFLTSAKAFSGNMRI